MAVVRQTNLVAFENDLSQATLDWNHDSVVTGLDSYLFKHGVFHLLSQGQVEDAKRRMLDAHFMAEFRAAYETMVEPLKAFRFVGVEEMRQCFLQVAETLPDGELAKIEDAKVYNRVSGFLWAIGLYDAGLVFEKKSHPIFERILGPEDPLTLYSLSNLGGLYKAQGRYKEAEPLYVGVLEARGRVLGLEHPMTLLSLGNLGNLYKAQGRYKEAEPLCLEDLKLTTQIMGVDHPDTFCSMNNLGELYEFQERYEEAEALYLQTLEGRKRIIGTEHPSTVISICNLGYLC